MENNTQRPNGENMEPQSFNITNEDNVEAEKFDITSELNQYGDNLVLGENFVMVNEAEPVNNAISEENTEVKPSIPVENTFSENMNGSNIKANFNSINDNNNTSSNYNSYNQKKTNKKPGMFKKVMSYVLVGVVCTTIGGAASGAAILYGLPNTSLFKNSPLYKSISGSTQAATTVYDNHPTQLSTTGSAMSATEIAKKVGPAVVAVTTTIQGQQDFFGRQGVQQGVGSGMIISQEGYVLTNYHVVEGAQQVKVVLSNGKQANAKVVNYDANYDVAVVQITDKVDIPAVVELGDSNSLQVGEEVVAIGNPLGTDFFGSVTTGIVSALNRKISGDTNKATYIQTDAAINSGNSGGPLINSRGQVVGINTAKIKESGVEGLGFAIPINAIKDKISNLSKPILLIGIQGREIDSEISKQYNMPVGLYVQQVTEFSPAEKAGIQAGDVIIKFDGQKVTTFDEVNTIKAKHKAGDQVSVTLNRDGKEQTVTLKLTESK
ncbi:S1C family serine protease [Clostridium omnivorum]|uniref:Type I deoxyribonuclease HsdR n=1 Tax=Clostridium omnivorum TaxID=1604902 RepID=A0ABQ5N9M9_9CLOT|nr:trypsin-like peptidase domain-containing protein [Clostridium sp. E14]GLC31925.1 type I deoxyribonuclease HsdR [Clostridium sp. E14]